MNIFEKTKDSIKVEGFWPTIFRIFTYPFRYKQRKMRRIDREENWMPVFSLNNIEERFTSIYQKNLWGSSESASGTGSTFNYTKNIRSEIPLLIHEFGFKYIFDAPCGDFNWMKSVLDNLKVIYVGGDIVQPLICSLNRKYKRENISFIHINLVDGLFPRADLMICRDCLFHLSYKDIKAILKNFIESKIPYILTTTHKEYKFLPTDMYKFAVEHLPIVNSSNQLH
jgi:hypothetical protein